MSRTTSLMMALVAWLLVWPVASAQEATPSVASGASPLLRLVIDDLPPDGVVDTGMTRTTFAPGATSTVRAGSGASVLWVESGVLTLSAVESALAVDVVRGGGALTDGTPEATGAGDPATLRSGDAVVLAAASTTEIRNDGAGPAETLTLLAAPDGKAEPDSGVVESVLVGGERPVPPAPVTLVLERLTLEPAERLMFAEEPAATFAAALVRKQNVKLGISPGAVTNRDTVPMPIYVLTIAVVSSAATPVQGSGA